MSDLQTNGPTGTLPGEGASALPPAGRRTSRFAWLSVVAVLAVTGGALFAVTTLSRLPNDLRRYQRRAEDLARLHQLEAGWRSERQALDLFEKLPAHQPAPLAELAVKTMGGTPPSIRLREAVPAAGGWTLRRAEVKLDVARLEDLSRLLAAAESGRPPWRLAEFSLTASEAAGAGRAVLVFEGLEKGGG